MPYRKGKKKKYGYTGPSLKKMDDFFKKGM